jgi:hypothetical protein
MKKRKAKPMDLISLRRAAEEAVTDMPEGELRVKAFEVILEHMLATGRPPRSPGPTRKPQRASRRTKSRRADAGEKETLRERVRGLKDSDFFKEQRTIGDVRLQLKAAGWHYSLSTIGGALLSLTQQHHLRREQVKSGSRKIWMYSNP